MATTHKPVVTYPNTTPNLTDDPTRHVIAVITEESKRATTPMFALTLHKTLRRDDRTVKN